MNSSNCSARGTEERQQRKWKRLREKGAERVLTHRGDRQRCSWQACFALASSQDGTSWRLSIKWIITTVKCQQKNHYQENIKPNISSIDISFQGEPRITADTSLGDLSASSLQAGSRFVKREPVNRISSAS